MEQRLQKLLAAAGAASRRQAEKLIISGRVTVNGIVVTELGTKADPDIDIIMLDGKPIDLHPKSVYILLNKPRGYTSSRRDPHAKRLVTDLVKDVSTPVYPVGRLDIDTAGLIILTNDGDFAFKVTHPSHHITKTYRAEVAGQVLQETLVQLEKGIVLADGLTAPAKASLVALDTMRQTSIVDITIREGKNRQVRRMFDAVGHPVIWLSRIKVGNITLGKLKPGEWRFMSQDEVESLLALSS
ncbi:MAG: pseudouridine synthase [Armatimonadota bacterium]